MAEIRKHLKSEWIIALLVLPVVLYVFSPGDTSKVDPVRNSGIDGSVWQAEQYLKERLKDPDSYQSIQWSKVQKHADGYRVSVMYRAMNGLGGMSVEAKRFELDDQGNVLEMQEIQPTN